MTWGHRAIIIMVIMITLGPQQFPTGTFLNATKLSLSHGLALAKTSRSLLAK